MGNKCRFAIDSQTLNMNLNKTFGYSTLQSLYNIRMQYWWGFCFIGCQNALVYDGIVKINAILSLVTSNAAQQISDIWQWSLLKLTFAITQFSVPPLLPHCNATENMIWVFYYSYAIYKLVSHTISSKH